MRISIVLLSILLSACSSKSDRPNKGAPENVTNQSFQKEKALKVSEVQDYYKSNAKTLNPALQDETLDRMSSSEVATINSANDPLLDISVRCMRRDFNGAFEIASKSFNRYQKVPQYWNTIANCHLNAGAYRKALLFYNKTLEVSPNYVPALNNIGVMYARQGQEQKALVAFERANKQSKFSKTPRYNLAKLYLSSGLAELAQPLLLSLLNEAPSDVDLLNAVASTYFFYSDYQQALSYYQRIPKTQWSRPEIGLNLALTLKKVGKDKEANDVFDDIKKPSDSNSKRYYGKIEVLLGAAK